MPDDQMTPEEVVEACKYYQQDPLSDPEGKRGARALKAAVEMLHKLKSETDSGRIAEACRLVEDAICREMS